MITCINFTVSLELFIAQLLEPLSDWSAQLHVVVVYEVHVPQQLREVFQLAVHALEVGAQLRQLRLLLVAPGAQLRLVAVAEAPHQLLQLRQPHAHARLVGGDVDARFARVAVVVLSSADKS